MEGCILLHFESTQVILISAFGTLCYHEHGLLISGNIRHRKKVPHPEPLIGFLSFSVSRLVFCKMRPSHTLEELLWVSVKNTNSSPTDSGYILTSS